jgi:quinol monooxygenase YgiN
MIIVTGWVKLAPGQMDSVIAAALAMIKATSKEPGCIDYAFARDLTDPDMIRISERWIDQAALGAHFASPHMANFNAALAKTQILAADVISYNAEELRPLIRLP